MRSRKQPLEPNPIADGTAPPPPASAQRLPAPRVKGWAKASDALERITSVRTIFPDFDRAVRRGGLPIGRITTLHGPTHGGKTAFALGLVKSFVDGNHLGALVDAEHATGLEFVEELLGEGVTRNDNFYAMRPRSYEETIDAVDSLLNQVKAVRIEQPDTKSIICVDSINKLVPARELKEMLRGLSEGGDDAPRKGGKRGAGGAEQLAKGHWGRTRAALNQSWLDHLVPMLGPAGCALVLIAQEREEEPDWGMKPDIKVKGGAALMFDSSLLIRVSKAQPLYEGSDRDESKIIGFQHRVRIWKSKVGHMDGRHSDCVFHLSNGRFAPAGFDTARDAIYVGKNLGVVTAGGSWLSWRKQRWQGENRAVTSLSRNSDQLVALLADVHAAIDKQGGRAA